MAYKMNLNFNYFPMFPCLAYPTNQAYLFPGSYQLNLYSEFSPPQEVKKYKRTWTKLEIEHAFNVTMNHCQNTQKSIESLEINDFALISMGLRQSPEQVMIKIREIKVNGTLSPGKWAQTEDELLVELIQKTGQGWGHIANILNIEKHNRLPIRNSKACKERWNNYLDPSINRGSWSKEEDMILLKGYLKFGHKWKSICRYISTRTEGAVKNRTKSLVYKIKQKCKMNENVEMKIKELVEESDTLE